MAKAQFFRNQKVWVESVGAWATVEKIVPVWARGFDEPVKITYDVGFGREFQSHELRAEEANDGEAPLELGNWRLLRAKNKWQVKEDCQHHPYPGTYPVVVTDKTDWGGWRTPGAEYDRDPRKMEFQARLIASSPKLLQIARELHAIVAESPDQVTDEFQALAKRCGAIMRGLMEIPCAPEDEDLPVMTEEPVRQAG